MTTSKKTTPSRQRSTNLLVPSIRISSIVLVVLASLHLPSSSVVVVGAEDLTLQQVFDAIDSNHDHSISEVEYNYALNKLIGTGDGASTTPDGAGAAAAAGGAPLWDWILPQRTFNPKFPMPVEVAEAVTNTNSINPASTAAFLKALFASFSAIMATEIGDKTFFIAAILSMRNDRMAVFGGAILALIIMTILSTLMGLVLPSLMPKKYTHWVGGVLFLYFGFKLLIDSRSMEDKVSEELEEVEEELAEMNKKKNKARKKKHAEDNGGSGDSNTAMMEDVEGQMENAGDGENGAKQRRGAGSAQKSLKHAPSSGMSSAGDYSGSSWEAVFLQALTMTFLAEWGDRSQIATIALAAAKDPIGVTIGGCIGHSICTGMAVVGGRMLASRISEKSVAFYGGLVFLAFGIHSAFFEE